MFYGTVVFSYPKNSDAPPKKKERKKLIAIALLHYAIRNMD